MRSNDLGKMVFALASGQKDELALLLVNTTGNDRRTRREHPQLRVEEDGKTLRFNNFERGGCLLDASAQDPAQPRGCQQSMGPSGAAISAA
jgi:hypothetical protein